MDLARVTRFFRSSFPHVTPKDHFLELARRRPLEELRTEGFADLVGLVIADPFMGSEISWELRQRPRELRAMSLPRLVRFVMEVPCLWAAVVWELERRPRLADAEVGRSLALSYREGRVSAEITAALLPLVGGDEAYGMAREMLLAGLAVYNASAAMLELDLDVACDDLFEILCDEATSLPVRRATANALSARQHPRIVPAVIDAVRSGRLGPFRGRDALMGQPISEAQLVTWLGENDGTIRALAFDLASRRLDKQLGEVMWQALRKGRYVVEPHDAGITSVFLASRAGSANS
jgi:hypothetical protein